jgi:hypothetical protein
LCNEVLQSEKHTEAPVRVGLFKEGGGLGDGEGLAQAEEDDPIELAKGDLMALRHRRQTSPDVTPVDGAKA